MIKQPYSKIALVGDMLGEGGAERVQARLSVFFEEHGVEVHHIIVRDIVAYEYAGELFNMGKLKNDSNGILNRFKRFSALKKYLKIHQFDYIIDFRVKNRFLQEYIIANFIYKAPYIMSIRSFETAYYFPKNSFLARNIYKKAYGLLTVSKALEEKLRNIYGYRKLKTIYNPIIPSEIAKKASGDVPFKFKYVLGIGRMKDNIKQFDHLILAFKKAKVASPDCKLVLMGEGPYKEKLERLVRNEGIEDYVLFLPFQENPFPYLKHAYFTALTSKNEGFPNALIESLACETPVVAYDCESGPNEIILHEHNGLLVKNQDIEAMTTAIGSMFKDDGLYQKCKSNATTSVERFHLNTIGKEWLDYLKIQTEL